jgi:hypothetical protein
MRRPPSRRRQQNAVPIERHLRRKAAFHVHMARSVTGDFRPPTLRRRLADLVLRFALWLL